MLKLQGETMKLEYQLVDPADFAIVEPANARSTIKLFQALRQSRSLLLFEPAGLNNLCCRLMKQLIYLRDPKIDLKTALTITVH
jgi:hypothetical protein